MCSQPSALPLLLQPVSPCEPPQSIRVGTCSACKAAGAPEAALCPHCPACGHLRPKGRLVFCAPICAATHRAIWSLLLEAGDQIDMPFLFGSASQIAGTKPGDQLYVRSSMAPVLHVRAVTELRERGEVVGLEAADVHGWRATERHRIGTGELEGWTPYGHIGPSGEFQAAEGSQP